MALTPAQARDLLAALNRIRTEFNASGGIVSDAAELAALLTAAPSSPERTRCILAYNKVADAFNLWTPEIRAAIASAEAQVPEPPPPDPIPVPVPTGLPAWLPARGTIGNISLNTLADVNPCPANNCPYTVGGQRGLMSWVGCSYVADDGQYGALGFSGGGHGDYFGNEHYVFNIDIQKWKLLTPPSMGGTFPRGDAEYGEYDPPSERAVSCHNYGSLHALSAADGGGPKGSTIQVMSLAAGQGAGVYGYAHAIDHATGASKRFSSNAGSFVVGPHVTAFDSTRKRFMRVGGNGLKIGVLPIATKAWIDVSLTDDVNMSIPTGQSSGGYCPEKDMLLLLESIGVGPVKFWGLECAKIDAGTAKWKLLNVTGDLLPDGAVGVSINYRPGKHFGLFNSSSQYSGTIDNFVRYLTWPAGAITDPWVLTRETFGGVAPAPCERKFQSYNRFQWATKIGCWIWFGGINTPVQAWRPKDTEGTLPAPSPEPIPDPVPIPPPPVPVPPRPQVAGAPFLAFSDLTSGPKTGNTDTSRGAALGVDGAYVSMWGNRLGIGDLSSSRVKIGGAWCKVIYAGPAIPPWSPATLVNEMQNMQLIIAQVNHAAADGPGEIVVTVAGVESNALPFTVRPGRIFYITDTGNDATADGSWQKPLGTYRYINGVADRPGDICYVKDFNASATVRLTTIPTEAMPCALIAYPGSSSQLGTDDTEALEIYNGFNEVPFWTVSKFVIRGSISPIGQPRGHSLMGCNVSAGHTIDRNQGCIGGGSDRTRLMGCELHHVGSGATSYSDLYHLIYYSGGKRNSPVEVPDVTGGYEIAWNYFHDNLVNRNINVFNDFNTGNFSSHLLNGKVHHNFMRDCCGSGIGFMSCTAGHNWIYSNILLRCGLENPLAPPLVADPTKPIYVIYDGMHIVGSYSIQGMLPGHGYVDPARIHETVYHIWNNDVIDCGAVFDPAEWRRKLSSGAWALQSDDVYDLDMHNNLTWQRNGVPYITPGNKAVVRALNPAQCSNNAWYGAGPAPAFDSDSVTVDPKIDPTTLRPLADSPLIGAHVPVPCLNFDGNPVIGIGAL